MLEDFYVCGQSEFTQVLEVGNIVDVAAENFNACVVSVDGRVSCWGDNRLAQNGSGTTSPWAPPSWIAGIDNAVRVAVAGANGCALLRDGTVTCWGGAEGSTPMSMAGVNDAVGLALTGGQVCVVRAAGRMACWGLWPDASPNDAGLDDAVSILSSGADVCVVRATGQIWCRGGSWWGAIGAPSPDVFVELPVSDVVELAMGHGHICIRKRDRTVHCAGWNISGQLGDGTRDNRSEFREAPSLAGVELLGAGVRVTLGLLPDGRVTGCGSNSSGEQDTRATGDSSIVVFATTEIP